MLVMAVIRQLEIENEFVLSSGKVIGKRFALDVLHDTLSVIYK